MRVSLSEQRTFACRILSRREEFGNDRWLGAVRALPDWTAQESLQYLMKRVDEFVGATRQSDDITCLVFRCK